eukprot:scaffold2878_cov390-Prasinococcus_capsulatus_cf.AAC.1
MMMMRGDDHHHQIHAIHRRHPSTPSLPPAPPARQRVRRAPGQAARARHVLHRRRAGPGMATTCRGRCGRGRGRARPPADPAADAAADGTPGARRCGYMGRSAAAAGRQKTVPPPSRARVSQQARGAIDRSGRWGRATRVAARGAGAPAGRAAAPERPLQAHGACESAGAPRVRQAATERDTHRARARARVASRACVSKRSLVAVPRAAAPPLDRRSRRPGEAAMLLIRLRTQEGLERVQVPDDGASNGGGAATVGDLRAQIEAQLGIPAAEQVLSLRQELLLQSADLAHFAAADTLADPAARLNVSSRPAAAPPARCELGQR